MKAKNSTVHVSRTIENSNTKDVVEDVSDSSVIAVHKFVTTPAEVTVDYSLPISLSKYLIARINIAVKVPCYKEEMDDAYEFAAAWVEQRMEAERDKIVGDREG